MSDTVVEKCDVCIVGAGIAGMNALFAASRYLSSDQTVILLCNPKNIHVGIWRQIRIESARDISEGTLKIVATLRFDVKFAEETGVAKAINVQL